MVRRRGELGFRRARWDEALDTIAERIRASSPDRLAFYLTSRGEPNENYHAAQKAVRAIGVLIDRTRRSPQAGIPDYNAFVSVARQRDSAAA